MSQVQLKTNRLSLIQCALVAVLVVIYYSTNNIHSVEADDDEEEEGEEQGMSINRTEDGKSDDALEDSLFKILGSAMDTKAVIKATEIISMDQKLCLIWVYVKSKKCVGRVQRLLANDEFSPFQTYMYTFNLNFSALMIQIHKKYFLIARTPDDCDDLEDTEPMKDLLFKMKSFMNERNMKETFLEEIQINQFYVKLFRDINYKKAFKYLAKVKLSAEYTMLMRDFYALDFNFKTFAEAYIFPDLEAPIRLPVDSPGEPPL